MFFFDELINDFDIDILCLFEDYFDFWFGILIVVFYDRWFLEWVCDVVWVFMGDGMVVFLFGGIF